VLSQILNPTRQPPRQLSITCDLTNTYCTDANPPSVAFLSSAALQDSLRQVLQPGAGPSTTLSFGPRLSQFGNLFIVQPIQVNGGGAIAGALVVQVDGTSLFAPYVQARNSRILIRDGNVVIDRAISA
jgi:hypothetical protein